MLIYWMFFRPSSSACASAELVKDGAVTHACVFLLEQTWLLNVIWLRVADVNTCGPRVHWWHRYSPHLSALLKYFPAINLHLLFSCFLPSHTSIWISHLSKCVSWYQACAVGLICSFSSHIKLDFGQIVSRLCLLYSTAVWFRAECVMVIEFRSLTHCLCFFRLVMMMNSLLLYKMQSGASFFFLLKLPYLPGVRAPTMQHSALIILLAADRSPTSCSVRQSAGTRGL